MLQLLRIDNWLLLEFVSTESIINETSRVNKKFTGNVSNIVDDIIGTRDKKGILTKKEIRKR